MASHADCKNWPFGGDVHAVEPLDYLMASQNSVHLGLTCKHGHQTDPCWVEPQGELQWSWVHLYFGLLSCRLAEFDWIQTCKDMLHGASVLQVVLSSNACALLLP